MSSLSNPHTSLITISGREVLLYHNFLNDDFCEDAKEYYNQKTGQDINYNTYFLTHAIHSYIIDNDLDPVYENQPYVSNSKINLEDIF
jgi:hypothetical protein